MALIKCKECKEKISSKAESCPSCGAKVKKKTSVFTWIIGGFFAVIVYTIASAPEAPKKSSAQIQAELKETKERNERYIAEARRWKTHTSKDKMTGETSVYASSATVPSTNKLDRPYHDAMAYVGVGCNAKSEWVYVGFNEKPNLIDTETQDGYNIVSARIKWDNSLSEIKFRHEWSSNFLHFYDDLLAIQNINKHKTVMIQLRYYGGKNALFEIPLDGSSAALKEIRELCSKL